MTASGFCWVMLEEGLVTEVTRKLNCFFLIDFKNFYKIKNQTFGQTVQLYYNIPEEKLKIIC